MSKKNSSILRLKRFEAAETARKVGSLENLIRDLDALAGALSDQIAAEEERTKVTDPRRPHYSMVAKAAAARRNKLITSLVDLRSKLEAAKLEHRHVASMVRDLELAQDVPSESANMAQAKDGKAPSHM